LQLDDELDQLGLDDELDGDLDDLADDELDEDLDELADEEELDEEELDLDDYGYSKRRKRFSEYADEDDDYDE